MPNGSPNYPLAESSEGKSPQSRNSLSGCEFSHTDMGSQNPTAYAATEPRSDNPVRIPLANTPVNSPPSPGPIVQDEQHSGRQPPEKEDVPPGAEPRLQRELKRRRADQATEEDRHEEQPRHREYLGHHSGPTQKPACPAVTQEELHTREYTRRLELLRKHRLQHVRPMSPDERRNRILAEELEIDTLQQQRAHLNQLLMQAAQRNLGTDGRGLGYDGPPRVRQQVPQGHPPQGQPFQRHLAPGLYQDHPAQADLMQGPRFPLLPPAVPAPTYQPVRSGAEYYQRLHEIQTGQNPVLRRVAQTPPEALFEAYQEAQGQYHHQALHPGPAASQGRRQHPASSEIPEYLFQREDAESETPRSPSRAYERFFSQWEEAHNFLHDNHASPPRVEDRDGAYAIFKTQERCVKRLYSAMNYLGPETRDPDTSIDYRRIQKGYYDKKKMIATCWEIVHYLIDFYVNGSCLMESKDAKKYWAQDFSNQDRNADAYDRLDMICEAFRIEKATVKDALSCIEKIQVLVDRPQCCHRIKDRIRRANEARKLQRNKGKGKGKQVVDSDTEAGYEGGLEAEQQRNSLGLELDEHTDYTDAALQELNGRLHATPTEFLKDTFEIPKNYHSVNF